MLDVDSLDEAIEWSKRFLRIIGEGESEIVVLMTWSERFGSTAMASAWRLGNLHAANILMTAQGEVIIE